MRNSIIFFLLLILFNGRSLSADSTRVLIYRYFNNAGQPKSVKISKKLNEISGLAVAPDGRLFAHDDESGIIYQLDPQNARIIKEFYIGKKKPIKADFEDMCITDDYFYLVSSEGRIFRFTEGRKDQGVEWVELKTWLKKKYDVEGLCFDPESNSLLLVCKGFAGEGFEFMRAVYTFSLDSQILHARPRFLLSITDIIKKTPSSFNRKLAEFFLLVDPKSFSPSGIERHPLNGHFFILSSRSRMIIELDREGKILGVVELKTSQHNQPEGITFLPDYTLIISDESGEGRARLTFYPLKE